MLEQNWAIFLGLEMSQKTLEKKASQLPYLKVRKPIVSTSSIKHPARTLFSTPFGFKRQRFLKWCVEKILKQKDTASPSTNLYVENFRMLELDETSAFFHLQPLHFRKERIVEAAWSSERTQGLTSDISQFSSRLVLLQPSLCWPHIELLWNWQNNVYLLLVP